MALLNFSCEKNEEFKPAVAPEVEELNEFLIQYQGNNYAFTLEDIDSVRHIAREYAKRGIAGSNLVATTLDAIHKYRSNNLVVALPQFLGALEMARSSSEQHIEAAIDESVSRIYRNLGNFDRALSYQEDAHALWESLELQENIGHSLNFQGMILLRSEEYDDAIEKFNKAYLIFDSLGDDRGIPPTLDQIGRAYQGKEDWDKALTYHQRVYTMTKDFKPKWKIAAVRSLADCHQLIGNDTEALELYDEAVDLILPRDTLDRVTILLSVAKIHHRNKAWDEAEEVLSKTLSELDLIGGGLTMKSQVHQMLADVYENTRRPTEALVQMRLYQKRLGESQKITDREAINRLTVEHQVEKQDLLIKNQQDELRVTNLIQYVLFGGLLALLVIVFLVVRTYLVTKKAKEKIGVQNGIITENLKERETLLKEIHHRVKNNLQIIANLLYLQSGKFEDESIKDVLEEGQGRVRSMSLIHQKLYENEDLKSIPFGEYIMELVNEIKSSFGEQAAKVQVNVKADDAYFDVESAVPLGLIINELTTNTFKYAFEGKDEGEFNVYLTRDESSYQLHVSDNGKGLPEEIDLRRTRSLGLRLVRILSDQLEGEYSFEVKEGTTFVLKFAA